LGRNNSVESTQTSAYVPILRSFVLKTTALVLLAMSLRKIDLLAKSGQREVAKLRLHATATV
jgi:hypothetical protein